MELKAKLNFSREDLTEILEEKVTKQGYSMCGDVIWDSDGGAHVEVRPMTDEEKKESGLDPRDPVEVVMQELHQALEIQRERGEQIMKGLFDLIDQVPERVVNALPEQKSVTQAFSSDSTNPEEDDEEEIALIDEEDYDLTDKDERNQYVARKRIERIRREQKKSRDIYGDAHKDEDGFVVLGPKED